MPKPRPWKTLESRYLIQDPWLTVRADRCQTEEGALVEPYYVLEYPDWVHVFAVNAEFQILLVRQYRHATADIVWELPCGRVDASDADPSATAHRELREETGCQAEGLIALPSLSPNLATHTNHIHSFFAWNTRQVGQPLDDPTERLESHWLELREVLDLIQGGQFNQALQVATVFLALPSLKQLQAGGRPDGATW